MRRHLVQSILAAAMLAPAAPSMAAASMSPDTFWPKTFGPTAHTNQDRPAVAHTTQDHALPVSFIGSFGVDELGGTLAASPGDLLYLPGWPTPAGKLSASRLVGDLIGGYLPEPAVLVGTSFGLAEVDRLAPADFPDLVLPGTGPLVSPPGAPIPAPGTLPMLLLLSTLPWTRRRRRS